MKSIIQGLLESDIAVTENYDVDNTIAKLYVMQESCEFAPQVDFSITAKDVPVRKVQLESGFMYLLKDMDLKRLMDDQQVSASAGIEQICDTLAGDSDFTDPSCLAVLVKKEDPSRLKKIIQEDPATLSCKCEQVLNYIDTLKEIQESGAYIVML